MTGQNTETWLTQEAFDRRKAELEQLEGEGRSEIAKRIEAAREEGDLKENGGYHAAKEEQGKIEARIRVLKELLRTAKVGTPDDDGIVEPGCIITARIQGDEEVFLLGSREILDDSAGELSVYSEASPLGEAINGHKVGDTVSYTAPNGREISVTIDKVQPYSA